MVQLQYLLTYTNELLQIERFKDYCPNGLQVEGKAQIKKIVSGVSASLALLEAAIAEQADAILVHHGYFWSGENLNVTGLKRHRLAQLLQHNVSLLAYHLPLDGHTRYGNNIQLAEQLNIKLTAQVDIAQNPGLFCTGRLAKRFTSEAFSEHLCQKLKRLPLHLPAGDPQKPIQTVAWCTGGAQRYVDYAIDAGVDAYITGEVSEPSYHIAKEANIHIFAAGHHATERYGVQALGQHLAEKFQVQHQYIDINNPV